MEKLPSCPCSRVYASRLGVQHLFWEPILLLPLKFLYPCSLPVLPSTPQIKS